MPFDPAKLRRLRLRKKISVNAAAQAAGFKRPSQWSDIEGGRQVNLSVETLERVAGAVGTVATSLLSKGK